MVFPSWLRPCAVTVFAAGVLGLGTACHKSSEPSGTVAVSGYVTFTRVPMQYGTDGKPTGLGAAGAASPARSVTVRVYQLNYNAGPDGIVRQTWRLAGTTATDSNGYYSFNGVVYAGYSTFVEVDSIFQVPSGNQSSLEIIADPAGIFDPTLAQPERPIYVYRLGVDGVQYPDPVALAATSSSNAVPKIYGDTSVYFNLTPGSTWATTVPGWNVPGSSADPGQPQSHPSETAVPAGAQVLAILDTAYDFTYWYGDPTPSHGRGGAFDLHYYPGRTETPRRSFVVYDRSLTPLSWDGTQSHYFGSLSAGGTVAGVVAPDDAWDPGVLYPMFARNFLFGQGKTALFPAGPDGPDNEAPDVAVVDGLGDVMAATLLMTPWLTDTSAAAFAPRDIRTIPAQPGIGSPRTLAALGWQLNLQGYGVVQPGDYTSTGTYQDWLAKIADPLVMVRFFNLIQPYNYYTEQHGAVYAPQDICSIYGQAGRLQEDKQSGEPVDIKQAFPDIDLGPVLTHFLGQGTVWPRSGLTLAADWDGTTANANLPAPLLTDLPPFTLSMAGAVQIPDPKTGNAGMVFPNTSLGEVAFAKLAAYTDLNLRLSLTAETAGTPPVPGLPPGASIEVVVDGSTDAKFAPTNLQPQAFLFPATQGYYDLTLRGNPTDPYNPLWHWVRVRIISPSTRQPDVSVTVSLVPLVTTP